MSFSMYHTSTFSQKTPPQNCVCQTGRNSRQFFDSFRCIVSWSKPKSNWQSSFKIWGEIGSGATKNTKLVGVQVSSISGVMFAQTPCSPPRGLSISLINICTISYIVTLFRGQWDKKKSACFSAQIQFLKILSPVFGIHRCGTHGHGGQTVLANSTPHYSTVQKEPDNQ